MTSVFEQISRSFGGGLWIKRLPELRSALAGLSPSKADRTWIRDQIMAAHTKRQRGKILNLLLLALTSDPVRWAEWIRDSPILRPSRYEFDASIPTFLCNALIECTANVSAPSWFADYLDSTKEFLHIAPAIKTFQASTTKRLSQERKHAPKSLIALLDLMFLARQEFSVFDAFGLTPEEAADGVSYLLFQLSRISVLSPTNLGPLDLQQIRTSFYPRLISDACKLIKVTELEFLVSHFGYKCHYDATASTLTVYSPTPDLAKSLRHGYSHTFMQVLALVDVLDSDQMLSLKDVGKQFLAVMEKQGWVTLVENPVKRWRFAIPDFRTLRELASADKIFKEEFLNLARLCKELATTGDELNSFKIEGIEVQKLLRAQRAVNIFRFAMSEFLGKEYSRDPATVVQSLIPVFSRKNLEAVIALGCGEESASKIVDFLTWRPSDSTRLDVMYQPLIAAEGGMYMVPMGLLGSTDIVRNSLQLKRTRLTSGKNDLLGERVEGLFKELGWWTKSEIKYDFAEIRGDIDAAALSDDILFVFECKNSLHPCSTAELRTSFDHIQHGVEQLDKFLKLWSTSGSKSYLENKLGIDLKNVREVVTAVITGNRMFGGLRIGGHAVRPFYETGNFIKSGSINLFGNEVRLRPAGTLKACELQQFLVSDTLHQKVLASMERDDKAVQLNNIRIVIEDYCQNPQILADVFGVVLPDNIKQGLQSVETSDAKIGRE